jgi:hypothetical protein
VLSLLEVAQRGMTGPKVADKAWNMGFFRKLQELEKRYPFETFQDVESSDGGAWRNRILDGSELEDYFQVGIDLLAERRRALGDASRLNVQLRLHHGSHRLRTVWPRP